MVFLRNVFVQTCNTNNSFFNFFSGFTYSLSAYFNNENNEELTNCNAENTLGNTNNRQIKSMYIKNTSFIFSYQKYICSFINLHINSLTHIRENDKTDYSGHQDFVHALELEEEDEWSLDDIKTVVSVNFDTQGDELDSQNSTRQDMNIIFDSESQHSQVQDNYF